MIVINVFHCTLKEFGWNILLLPWSAYLGNKGQPSVTPACDNFFELKCVRITKCLNNLGTRLKSWRVFLLFWHKADIFFFRGRQPVPTFSMSATKSEWTVKSDFEWYEVVGFKFCFLSLLFYHRLLKLWSDVVLSPKWQHWLMIELGKDPTATH